MSLPTWNRKASSRVAAAAAISALAVFTVTSVATADVNKKGAAGPQGHAHHGYAQQQATGWNNQYGAPQGFGLPQGYAFPQGYGAPSGYPAFNGVVPASTYQGEPAQQQVPVAVQGQPQAPAYGGAVAPDYASVPAGIGYPAAVPFQVPQGYVVPGPTSAPSFGYNPFGVPGGFEQYGFSPYGFAPSEPNYAPAERIGASSYSAPAPVATAPAAPEPATMAKVAEPTMVEPAAATTPSYTYEVAPGNGTYVGTSTEYVAQAPVVQAPAPVQVQAPAPVQVQAAPAAPAVVAATSADPYSVILQQQSQPTYTAAQPSFSTAYDNAVAAPAPAPAPVAIAPAPAPAPVAVAPAPAYETYQQSAVSVGGYEFSTAPAAPAPAAPAADYYDLNAAAAAAAPLVQQAPVGGHFVQVAAFKDPNRANKLIAKLAAAGEQAFAIPAQVRGKLYHRVRIGAADKRDARAVRNRVRNLGYYEARVVKG